MAMDAGNQLLATYQLNDGLILSNPE